MPSYGRFKFQTEGGAMPLYMDIHNLDGAVTFEDVGKAHQADLKRHFAVGRGESLMQGLVALR